MRATASTAGASIPGITCVYVCSVKAAIAWPRRSLRSPWVEQQP